MNVPGVVGKIGSLLGDHEINIAEMHLGRSEVGGVTAGAVMVDQDVPQKVIDEIVKDEDIRSAHIIDFD